MVQAAAQAQAVVAAAKNRGDGLVPMNSSQISALSQIQAQAIVNARPSTALIATGKSEKDGKPTPEMIQNQIQLQAQALVHAHTQAQIAAGIFKGVVNENAQTATPNNPIAKKARITPNPSQNLNPSTPSIKPLENLTKSQMKQQNDLTKRQASLHANLLQKHAQLEANLRSCFANTPTESQANQMKGMLAKHMKEIQEQQNTFSKELQDLQNVFRRQNAAAEYAGLPRGQTVPNPVKAISIGPTGTVTSGALHSNAIVCQSSNQIIVPSQSQSQLAYPNQPICADNQLANVDGNSTVTSITNTSLDPPPFKLALHASLTKFWSKQLTLMQDLPIGTEQDFKNHNDLPLARIKRIMKSDEDVRMISAEAPVLFAKACELFILELTLRSWAYSEGNKRRTLQKEDIQTAIRRTDIFDFLVDVIN